MERHDDKTKIIEILYLKNIECIDTEKLNFNKFLMITFSELNNVQQ